MSLRLPLRTGSTLIALVMTLGLALSAAEASEPVVIESSAWTTTGTMKAKVDSLQQQVDVVVTLEFGPSVDLLAGQFRLTVDDGVEPFEIVGVYEERKPGKPSFPDLGDAAAAALGLVPELEGLQLESKIKAKPRWKDGVESIQVAFKIKVKLPVDGEVMSIAVGYKGEGGRIEWPFDGLHPPHAPRTIGWGEPWPTNLSTWRR